MNGLADIEYYERFFENIAISLLEIGHDPAGGRKSFFFAKAKDTTDNVRNSFDKNGTKLLLKQFVSNPFIAKSGQVHSENAGMLEVLVYFDKAKYRNEVMAQKKAYLVLLKILGYMRFVSEEDEALHNFDFDQFEIDPIGPVYDNFFGYQLTFPWINNVESLIAFEEEDWKDGQYPS